MQTHRPAGVTSKTRSRFLAGKRQAEGPAREERTTGALSPPEAALADWIGRVL